MVNYDYKELEWKWIMNLENRKHFDHNNNPTKEETLRRRMVNLSTTELTQSETSLLQKGLNFRPTPPPPRPDDVNKDIDVFGRRINLREYHAPDNLDEIKQQSIQRPTILEKLSQRGQHGEYYRPSREPYLNSYVDNLRQDINKKLLHHHRFECNNLTKLEKAVLERLRANPDIIIKPEDKGGVTVILNKED